MKEEDTGRPVICEAKTDWQKLTARTDNEVRATLETDPDIHPTDEDFWSDAKVVMPIRKETVTMRLDADLLAWFKKEKGYQTRINAVLRAYMKAKGTSQVEDEKLGR